MSVVVFHVVRFAVWFLINMGLSRWLPKSDPYPFLLPAMVVSVSVGTIAEQVQTNLPE